MSGPSSYPRRRHTRLAGYDYASPGYYFVTICTQQRVSLFGSAGSGGMRVSPAGVMVRTTWHEVAARSVGVTIDAEIALPDHVHAIIRLEDVPERTLSLLDVVHRYKSLTTKRYAHGVHEKGWPPFAGRLWQVSFHDQVIRRDEELYGVRRYIAENVLRFDLRQMADG